MICDLILEQETDIISIPDQRTAIVHESKVAVDLVKYVQDHVFTFDAAFHEDCNNQVG